MQKGLSSKWLHPEEMFAPLHLKYAKRLLATCTVLFSIYFHGKIEIEMDYGTVYVDELIWIKNDFLVSFAYIEYAVQVDCKNNYDDHCKINKSADPY